MNLIKIDLFDSQSLEAGLRFAPNRIGLQVVRDRSGLVPYQAALGENMGTGSDALDRTADDGLRVSEPIDGSRIDPVDAAIQSGVDGGYRFVIVLRAPCEFPFSAADRDRKSTRLNSSHLGTSYAV